MTSLFSGFVAGWTASRRLGILPRPELSRSYLGKKGDAPDGVRTAVTRTLRSFQAGYNMRDLHQLGKFMQRLFPNDDHSLICGTDPGEWIEGHDSVQRFIGSDWANWGDLRLKVDNVAISSVSDVAWLATTGTVSNRPIRFLAVLTRTGDRWLFRQIQFQWDANWVKLSDLARPSLIARIHLQ